MALAKKALLVESESEAREQRRRWLAAAHFDVHTAGSAGKALEALRSGHFGVVIADETLPDMDGFRLLDRLREIAAHASVVLLTSEWSNATALRASAQGALCLCKPVDEATLVAATRQRPARGAPRGRPRAGSRPSSRVETVSATSAKNAFGRVMDAAVRNGRVVITKRKSPHAVLLSFDEYARLVEDRDPDLDALSSEFEALLAGMQTAAAKNAARTLFTMSSDELAVAAVAATKER